MSDLGEETRVMAGAMGPQKVQALLDERMRQCGVTSTMTEEERDSIMVWCSLNNQMDMMFTLARRQRRIIDTVATMQMTLWLLFAALVLMFVTVALLIVANGLRVLP